MVDPWLRALYTVIAVDHHHISMLVDDPIKGIGIVVFDNEASIS
jgi:hypothetical protein